MKIDPDQTIAQLIEAHPQALEVLVEAGFKPLANPVMRRTMAKLITLRAACEKREIDLDTLCHALEQTIAKDENP